MKNLLLADSEPLNLDDIQASAFPEAPKLADTSIAGLISKTLPYIFGVAGMALLIYLIIGGFQIMLSRGDPKSVQAGQSKITNAVIGFVIVIFAFTLTQLLGQVLGLKGTLFSQIFGSE